MTLKEKLFRLTAAHPDWTVPHLALALNKKPAIIRAMKNIYGISVPRSSTAESRKIRKRLVTLITS